MYHVIYDAPKGVVRYCVQPMDYETALRMVALFCKKYLKADGSPAPYPNGKGHYEFTNPRIVNA